MIRFFDFVPLARAGSTPFSLRTIATDLAFFLVLKSKLTTRCHAWCHQAVPGVESCELEAPWHLNVQYPASKANPSLTAFFEIHVVAPKWPEVRSTGVVLPTVESGWTSPIQRWVTRPQSTSPQAMPSRSASFIKWLLKLEFCMRVIYS